MPFVVGYMVGGEGQSCTPAPSHVHVLSKSWFGVWDPGILSSGIFQVPACALVALVNMSLTELVKS